MKAQMCCTLPELLTRNANIFGRLPAFREKQFGIWQTWSWKETEAEVYKLSLGLIELGVSEGDHIAVIGRNRPQLYWSILGAQSVGAIPTPLYQDSVANELIYPLEHCGAKFAIVEDQEQVDKLLEIKENIPKLEKIIFLDPRGLRKYDKSNLYSFTAIQGLGIDNIVKLDEKLKSRKLKQGLNTNCILLYTSGTTGQSKGVLLCNRNVIESGKSGCAFDNITKEFSIVCYLPMAWVGDFAFTMGLGMWSGMCINCPESNETLQEDLREIGPTYFFGPPRFFESLLTSIFMRIDDASWIKRWLFKFFIGVANKVGERILERRPVAFYDRLMYLAGELIIYGPLRNQMGLSRTRVGYTAGEAIGPEIFQFFRSLGINLKQLYGQTEACVFVTCQPDGEVKSDSVGVPVSGVQIKISNDGEVFYKSPGAFVEYFKNEDATRATKDEEGWVATGDAGFIDKENGHLRIIDRVKDVGKMADGSLFAPKYVENKLKFYSNILEAVLFGNGKSKCVAFINIDLSSVGNWAEKNNLAYGSYQELAGHPEVYKMISSNINEVNASLADDEMLSGCQIQRFLILHKELDADDGEITRTRKVRRKIVMEKYSDLIDAMYSNAKTIFTETEVTYEDGAKGAISATITIQDLMHQKTKLFQ